MNMVEISIRDLRWLLITSWRYAASRHTYAPSFTLELLQHYKKYLNENDLEQIKSEAEWVLNMRKLEKDNIHNDIDNPTLLKAIEFANKKLKNIKGEQI
jgi:hypothetical protein